MKKLTLVAGLLAAVSFPSFAQISDGLECNAYEGWELLTEKARTHVVMFGEMHGTNESQEAVHGVLCELVKSGTPVKFGVEAVANQGEALNSAFSGDATPAEIYAAAPEMWGSFDGRSSQAVLKLLNDIAEWRKAGADIEVFAFDWTSEQTDMARWEAMAVNVDEAAKGFDGAIVLFAGGYHTTLNPVGSESEGGSLASGVSQRPALPVQMIYDGGEAYVTYSVDGSEFVTGVMSLPAKGLPPESVRTITIDPDDARQALYFTGPMTASPPAFPDGAPE